ncbi:MAG: hypothetical protein ACRDIX_01080 [Actinomycetota bacterium]
MQRSPRQVGLATVTALTLTTALTIVPASAAGAHHRPDLSTTAAIESYLVSIGVDPAEAVWQQGLRNYAGPSCPGAGWTCVAADAPIVQIAPSGGANVFECSGLRCVAVQVVPLGAGQNEAECERGDKHADTALQVCDITQDNETGNNVAVINQSIEQKGAVVTARQVARITQTEDSGNNIAGVRQVIGQSSQVKGTDQSQDAHQAATVDQVTESGDNSSNIDQSQKQTQHASGSTTITQDQNTTVGTDVTDVCDQPGVPPFDQAKNQCAHTTQASSILLGVGGDNRSNLNQDIKETQTASSAENADQQQGTELGGQVGTKTQTSSGVSLSEADQDTDQVQTATGVTNVNQSQDAGDPRCCQVQATNPANQADILQTTDQSASDEDADQDATLIGHCLSSGNCHVLQTATTDDDSETTECTGECGFVFTECTTVEGPTMCSGGVD